MNDYQDPSLEMDPTDDEEEEIITEQTYEDEVDLFEDIDEEEEILDENQSEEYDNEGLLEDADSDDMQDSEEEQKG
jgi:hypothetical protein